MKIKSRIWELAKTMPTFTIQDLKESGASDKAVRKYMSVWAKRGYVQKVYSTPITYKLSATAPATAPPTTGGEHHKTKEKETHMWLAMRAMKEATPIELSMVATIEGCAVSVSRATEWLRLLTAAGYLRTTDRGYRVLPSKCKSIDPPVIEKLARVTDGTTGQQVYLGPWRWINE